MSKIISDLKVLRQRSSVVEIHEEQDIIDNLKAAIPEASSALGLAAPQIGILKRVFIARFSHGMYAFVNPEISWFSSGQVSSIEGCLSLPGVMKCVSRYQQIVVTGRIINCDTGVVTEEMRLKDLDSFIAQHEIDHLDGILIIDIPQTKTSEEKYLDRQRKREVKLYNKRKLSVS